MSAFWERGPKLSRGKFNCQTHPRLWTNSDASNGLGNAIASTVFWIVSGQISETGANSLPRHSTRALSDAIYASAVAPLGENAKSAGPGAAWMDASSFPRESNAARDESVFSRPKDPENASVTICPEMAGPRMKLPASPYAGRSRCAPSSTNPSCGGAIAGCAQAPADVRRRAAIILIKAAPLVAQQ